MSDDNLPSRQEDNAPATAGTWAKWALMGIGALVVAGVAFRVALALLPAILVLGAGAWALSHFFRSDDGKKSESGARTRQALTEDEEYFRAQKQELDRFDAKLKRALRDVDDELAEVDVEADARDERGGER